MHLVLIKIEEIIVEAKNMLSGPNTNMHKLARSVILGVCWSMIPRVHPLHYIATSLVPFLEVPDLNKGLPWDQPWFPEALKAEDERTYKKCILNAEKQFKPDWVS